MKKEGQMFLYTLVDSLEAVMSVMCRSFGISQSRKTNRLQLENGSISMTVTVMCTDMGEEAEERIKEQTGGLCQRIYQTETELDDIKINLLHQIRRTRGIASIEYSYPEEGLEESQGLIDQTFFRVLKPLQAVIWVPEQENQAAGVYCCGENREKKMLFSMDGKSDMEEFMPYPGHPVMPGRSITQGQIKRRAKSRELLNERCIYVPANYPFLESGLQLKVRSPKEIAERAAALLIVSLYSECMLSGQTREQAQSFVKDLRESMGEEIFSPKEQQYLENPSPKQEEQIEFSWQYECLHVMEWALGITFDLGFPNQICDVKKAVQLLSDCHSVEDILDISHPKNNKELLDACDLIFCLDWACTDARIHKLPMPSGMDGGVVMERHKALNWLVGTNSSAPWDNVETNT